MTDLEYFTAIIFIAMTFGVYIYHLVAERKLRRDLETDHMMRKGMAEAYKRGLIASGTRPEFYRITKRVSK